MKLHLPPYLGGYEVELNTEQARLFVHHSMLDK